MSISRNSGVRVAGYPATVESAGQAGTGSRGGSAAALERLLQDRLALLGLVIIVAVVAVAVFVPYIAPNDLTKVNLQRRLAPPSAQYPLGTDHLGGCLLSRLIYGTRVSLATAALALTAIMLISTPPWVPWRATAGRGDNAIMRLVDVLLTFPGLMLALVIAGTPGPGLLNVMLALSAVWRVGYARVIRGMVLWVKEKEFVLAARTCGTRELGIITRHILRNVLSPVIVLARLHTGKLILVISGLSFLELGA